MADYRQWWSEDTIAVVTGSNKGLGLAIVQGLASRGLTTVLTARDEQKGLKALNTLKQQPGIDPAALHFHVLDVSSSSSVQVFTEWIMTKFGRLDILINNAGIAIGTPETPKADNAKLVIDTNYYGAKRMIESLMPLLNSQSPHGARIVNLSSAASRMDGLKNNKAVLDKLSNIGKLSSQIIDDVVDEFIQDLEYGRVVEKGWSPIFGVYDYCMSKMALNTYTRMVARDLAKEGRKIFVNCMCPGLTSTDMTKNNGHSAEVGADTAIWLALLPASESKTGGFFSRRVETGFDHIPLYMENGTSVFLDEFEESVRTSSAPRVRAYFKM